VGEGEDLTQMNINNIPALMRELDHWVLWKKEFVDDQWKKVPYQINGRKAKSNDHTTWTSFSNVLKCRDPKKYDGIGFEFFMSGITGIDIDHCIENEQINSHAREIMNQCRSYAEKSPSGTGIHIYVQGIIPSGVHDAEIEMYNVQYFTVTGNKLNNYGVEPRQDVLNKLHKRYVKAGNSKEVTFILPIRCSDPSPQQRPCQSDEQILQRAFNSKQGTEIRSLFFDGDLSMNGNDHSKADLSLCRHLAFWLDKDFDRIDRAFRQSALFREDKWGIRTDYSVRTINEAIRRCKQSRGAYLIRPPITPHCEETFLFPRETKEGAALDENK
jgi:putative DNA primase/helicase